MAGLTLVTHALIFADRGLLHQEEMAREMEKINRQIAQLAIENERFSLLLDRQQERNSSKNNAAVQVKNAIILRFAGEQETTPRTDAEFLRGMLNELNDVRKEGSILYFVFMTLVTLTITTVWNYRKKVDI